MSGAQKSSATQAGLMGQHNYNPVLTQYWSMSSSEIRDAAIVLSMIEVVVRPEPREYAPEISAYIRARRPSEIAEHIVKILTRGFYLWAELEEGRAGTLADLQAAGCSESEAVGTFVASVQAAKWQLIATLARERGAA